MVITKDDIVLGAEFQLEDGTTFRITKMDKYLDGEPRISSTRVVSGRKTEGTYADTLDEAVDFLNDENGEHIVTG